MSKYIDAEKLKKSVNRYQDNAKAAFNPIEDDADYYKGKIDACEDIQKSITSLQQEHPEEQGGHLEYWLEHFGMPEENIEKCVTQIEQGYGACRYLQGVQLGAEAVNEIAEQQEQPEVDLEEEIKKYFQGLWPGMETAEQCNTRAEQEGRADARLFCL